MGETIDIRRYLRDIIGHMQIRKGTVTGDTIAPAAITSGKIATGAVTGNKIPAGTITNNHIATGAVTNSKIATGTITYDRMADESAVIPRHARFSILGAYGDFGSSTNSNPAQWATVTTLGYTPSGSSSTTAVVLALLNVFWAWHSGPDNHEMRLTCFGTEVFHARVHGEGAPFMTFCVFTWPASQQGIVTFQHKPSGGDTTVDLVGGTLILIDLGRY